MTKLSKNSKEKINNKKDRHLISKQDGHLQECAGQGLRILFVLLFWLAIWQIIYMVIGKDIVFSSPVQVAKRLLSLIKTTQFWLATAKSLMRIAEGFFLGLMVGILLAILSVVSRPFALLFQPLLSMIRATPVSSFIIIALIWMSNVRVVVFIVFLMVMPIVWANLVEGIRKTDHDLLEMTKLFKFSRWKRMRLLYLPSLSPFLISAVTTSLGLGWKAGIAAEVLSTPDLSLGKALYESKIYLETQDLFAYTAVVIIVSMIIEKLVVKGLTLLQDVISHRGS